MNSVASTVLVASLVVLMGAILAPWVGVRMLLGSLKDSPKAIMKNFAGRDVVIGLGSVWVFWAGGMMVVQFVMSTLTIGWGFPFDAAIVLAIFAFCFGLFDDAYGTSESKGFKGHLKALAQGKMTTGGLKLFGISLIAFMISLAKVSSAPWVLRVPGSFQWLVVIGCALLAGAAIALTSNFINLTDLRPGRAQKSYLVLIAVGIACAIVRLLLGGELGSGTWMAYLGLGLSVAMLIGPIIATLSLDLGEVGMLGDAGANPLGALAGLFIISSLGFAELAVYTTIMLALNFASEKVSFSKVIAQNSVLTKFDNIGRLKDGI